MAVLLAPQGNRRLPSAIGATPAPHNGDIRYEFCEPMLTSRSYK